MRTALEKLVRALEAGLAAGEAPRPFELPQAEREQLLERFNATRVRWEGSQLIHERFEEQVRRTPQRVAVEDEEVALSYEQLNARANRLARHLRTLGVGAQSRVALCVERGAELVVGLLGILKSGAAYVPLDGGYPRERLSYMLQDARPQVLLTQQRMSERLPPCEAQLLLLDRCAEQIERQSGEDLTAREVGLEPSSLAYMIYTSGSTGEPKGVMVEHRNVVNSLRSRRQRPGILEEQERMLAVTTVSFDIAAPEIYLPLMVARVWWLSGGKERSMLRG